MKNTLLKVSITIFFSIILLIFSSYKKSSKQLLAISPIFQQDVNKFKYSLEDLEKAVEHKEENAQIIQKFKTCRLNFKSIEPLIAYLDQERYNYFNGANVLQLDQQIPGYKLIEPEGLQVIEALIVEDSIDYVEVMSLIKRLDYQLFKFSQDYYNAFISIFQYIEAFQYQLIRIETMGLTGFDCPIILNSAAEVNASLSTLKKYLQLWKNDKLLPIKDYKVAKKAIQNIENKLNTPFNDIDRYSIITENIYPLRSVLIALKQKISTHEDTETLAFMRRPVNFSVTSIYDINFIDIQYYTTNSYYNSNTVSSKNNELVELGKLLFYDSILSKNAKLSCSSCHQPDKYFSDGLTKSISNEDNNFQDRNTPTLLNAGFQAKYLYDLSANSLEDQLSHVILNSKEFNTNYKDIIERINQNEKYVQKFESNFTDYKQKAVNVYTINKALAAYVRSLKNLDSPFDQYMRKEKMITKEAKLGFNLFMGKAKCGTCHFAPTFYGLVPPFYNESETENIGVWDKFDTLSPVLDNDKGRFNFHKNDFFKGAFKTSTIRNIEMTSPYMHNGTFKTLEEVIEFYNVGAGNLINPKIENLTITSEKLNLNIEEQKAIIAFLKSLTGSLKY